jgi:hypothetical protein
MLEHVVGTMDVLHITLITGFTSFISSAATHLITKNRIIGKFPTAEQFYGAIADLKKSQEEIMRRMVDHCELMRSRCPFNEMVENVKDIKEELKVIKGVQSRRTEELLRKHAKDNEVWRVIMSKLSVPVEEQNRLLSGGN